MADAERVAGPDLLVVDTSAATADMDEPAPPCVPPSPAPIRRTVWYRVTAWDTTLQVATAGSDTGFRPIMALYAGDPASALTPVACGDAWSLRATVAPGQVYYLQVGGGALVGSTDGGRLHLMFGPAGSDGASDT